MLIVVVLPAPLLPSRAKTVPFWTLKLTSSRTETFLYDLLSDLASMAASMVSLHFCPIAVGVPFFEWPRHALRQELIRSGCPSVPSFLSPASWRDAVAIQSSESECSAYNSIVQ